MDVLADIRDHYNFTLENLGLVKFDNKSKVDQTTVALYASIIGLADAIRTLYKNDSTIGFGPLFRSLMEAYVDLILITDDKDYIYRMEASDLEAEIKLFRIAEKGDNAYVADLTAKPDLENVRQSKEDRLAYLKGQKLGAFTVADCFIKAGMESEYRTLYNYASSESHNNIGALVERHIRIYHEDSDLVMVLNKSNKGGEYDHHITTTSSILLRSGIRMHEKYETDSSKVFHERYEVFHENQKAHFSK
jgi:hypothetical protein